MDATTKHDSVQEYYGEVLTSSDDLQTNACCTDAGMPDYIKASLSKVHDEVLTRYYGCGMIAPECLKGARILDLGSGSGRDCYVLAELVGESGSVVGVDMTDAQLEVANRHVDYHRKAFGYERSNVTFLKGYIEKLDELGLEDNSFDIVISNCVINLCPDKEAVLKEVHRILKPGGEMYFSDVYADRRIPKNLRDDPVLYGECLSGALYWNDFLNVAKAAGFLDPRLVEDRPLTIDNPEIEKRVEGYRFFSATYRLFKLDGLEPACEDYGQAVVYKGTAPHHTDHFTLDSHHHMEKRRVFPVCGNTYRMLKESRLAQHFDFVGDFSSHYGIFPGCGDVMPFTHHEEGEERTGCC